MYTSHEPGSATPALLAPTEALLRGFEFAPEGENEIEIEAAAAGVAIVSSGQGAVDGIQARQGFYIGSLRLMIPYAEGSELTDLPTVYRLPNAPPWFIGMTNLHGMLVPVFDLARQFGIDHEQSKKPMLLVLAHGADAAGVVIDSLPQRLKFAGEHLADDATVPEAIASVVRRAVLINGQLWFDLDCAALLAMLEQSFGVAQ
jgi:twitching motility protein PilI